MKRFNEYFLVPISIAIILALMELLSYYGATRTVVLIMLVYAIFGRSSSIYSNLAGVVILAGYCFYSFDPYRASLIVISFMILGIYDAQRNNRLKIATEVIEHTVNGNLDHLKRIHEMAKNLHSGWRCPDDPGGREQAFYIADSLGDLRQKIEFWHQEAIHKKLVQEQNPRYNEI